MILMYPTKTNRVTNVLWTRKSPVPVPIVCGFYVSCQDGSLFSRVVLRATVGTTLCGTGPKFRTESVKVGDGRT